MQMLFDEITSALSDDYMHDLPTLANRMQLYSTHEQNKAILSYCCELVVPLCQNCAWVEVANEDAIISGFVGVIGWMLQQGDYAQTMKLLTIAEDVFGVAAAPIFQALGTQLYQGHVLKRDRYLGLHLYRSAVKVLQTAGVNDDAIENLLVSFAYQDNIFAKYLLVHEQNTQESVADFNQWQMACAEAGYVEMRTDLFSQYLAHAQQQPKDCLMLGKAYLEGVGVAQDMSQAKTWLQQASDKGSIAAYMLLCQLELADDPLQTMEKIKQVRGTDDLQTHYVSACCLEYGLFTNVDKMGALALFYDLLDADYGEDVLSHVLSLDEALQMTL